LAGKDPRGPQLSETGVALHLFSILLLLSDSDWANSAESNHSQTETGEAENQFEAAVWLGHD